MPTIHWPYVVTVLLLWMSVAPSASLPLRDHIEINPHVISHSDRAAQEADWRDPERRLHERGRPLVVAVVQVHLRRDRMDFPVQFELALDVPVA